jgi:hypothetical protein
VALHDIFTLEATSASDTADDTATAGAVKCVAYIHALAELLRNKTGPWPAHDFLPKS